MVAEPPTPTITTSAPASTAAQMSSPVPRVLAASASRSASVTRCRPEAAAISTTAVPPSSTSPYWALTGRPSGSVTSTVTHSPPRASISASIVPSPPSASGHRSGGISPARSSPRPIAPATSAAR